MSYNVMSNKAEEFINDEEILETLDYAEKHKTDEKLITSILEEAAKCNGLNHRDAAVLLACEVPELNQKIENLAKQPFSYDIFQKSIADAILSFVS